MYNNNNNIKINGPAILHSNPQRRKHSYFASKNYNMHNLNLQVPGCTQCQFCVMRTCNGSIFSQWQMIRNCRTALGSVKIQC